MTSSAVNVYSVKKIKFLDGSRGGWHLTGTCLSKDISLVKFSNYRSNSFSNLWKNCRMLQCLRIFTNTQIAGSKCGWLTTFSGLPCSKIHIWQHVHQDPLSEDANRETDRQTSFAVLLIIKSSTYHCHALGGWLEACLRVPYTRWQHSQTFHVLVNTAY